MNSTSSLGFAAYLILQGFKLIGHPIKELRKFRFNFDIDVEDMNKQYQDYAASQFHNFDSIIQNLKRNMKDAAAPNLVD